MLTDFVRGYLIIVSFKLLIRLIIIVTLEFIDGGISFVCFMDEDKGTVALVGGGSRPAFAMNKVVFYNYKERKVTNELICPRNIISIHSKKNL